MPTPVAGSVKREGWVMFGVKLRAGHRGSGLSNLAEKRGRKPSSKRDGVVGREFFGA